MIGMRLAGVARCSIELSVASNWVFWLRTVVLVAEGLVDWNTVFLPSYLGNWLDTYEDVPSTEDVSFNIMLGP